MVNSAPNEKPPVYRLSRGTPLQKSSLGTSVIQTVQLHQQNEKTYVIKPANQANNQVNQILLNSKSQSRKRLINATLRYINNWESSSVVINFPDKMVQKSAYYRNSVVHVNNRICRNDTYAQCTRCQALVQLSRPVKLEQFVCQSCLSSSSYSK